ncbi:hypothetical protein [Salinarimonas sp.]|uniref:hypothetical protein n=1 Tax=Salinarimonas sp. TaxID=2766526 RepID=UPI00391B0914
MSEQTAIVAEDRLFAGVGGHTQIDGALIAARSGALLIDTRTLGFSDIEERIAERVQDVQLGVNLGWGGDATGTERPGQGLPGATLSGQLASRDVERITRATVGPGQIVVRDEEAQTQDLAALNRDLDRAEEVIRDEAAGVRFYASDTAIMEIASGFATTRENLRLLGDRLGEALAGLSEQRREEAASLADALQASDDLDTAAAKIAEELVARGEIAPEAQEEIRQTLARAAAEALTDPEANAQLAACVAGGRQGFNLHDWLFPRAHAAAPAIAVGAAMSPGVVQACGQAAVALGALALGLWNQWQVLNNDANDAGTGPGMGHNQPPADPPPGIGHNQPPADGAPNPNQPPQGPGGQLGTIIAGGVVVTNPAIVRNELDFAGQWTPGPTNSPTQNALRHFRDHGREFGATTPSEYVEMVNRFVTAPPTGSLVRTRSSGDRVIFDPSTNTIAIVSGQGLPRTMYVVAPRSPTNPRGYDPGRFQSPLEYFNAQ